MTPHEHSLNCAGCRQIALQRRAADTDALHAMQRELLIPRPDGPDPQADEWADGAYPTTPASHRSRT